MLQKFIQLWPDLCVVLGGACGVIGSFMVANKHIRVKLHQIPVHLFFAFTKGRQAKVSKQASEWTREDPLQSMRGLALIAVGFFLQMIPSLWKLITQ
jgi:hypothetical protein